MDTLPVKRRSLLDGLSLPDMPTGRTATPKTSMVSQTTVNAQARKLEAKQFQVWRSAIWKRDGGLCRCCGRKVVKALENIPERGECHHVTHRAHLPTRYDVRNGVLLCNSPCHERVTGTVGKKLKLVTKKFFKLEGKTYPDATKGVTFSEAV